MSQPSISSVVDRGLLDSAAFAAAAALLSGALACHLSSTRRSSELTSELLCWVLLPPLFELLQRRRRSRFPVDADDKRLPPVNDTPVAEPCFRPSIISVSLVAIAITVSSVFRAEVGTDILFPAVALCLALLSQRDILAVSMTAVFSIAVLSEWDPLAYVLSLIPLVATFVAYALFTPHSSRWLRWLRWPRAFDIKTAIWPLSLRIALLLAIVLGRESYVIGVPRVNILDTVVLASVKACTWYFTAQLAQHTSWVVAAVAGTFSLTASQNPFSQQLEIRAIMTVVASQSSLGVIIALLPKPAAAKSKLWVLGLLPLLTYLANVNAIWSAQALAVLDSGNHTVRMLIGEHHNKFESMLLKQSGTYFAASSEYKRRYGLEPPPGFEEWFGFALSHQSPVIDEFDTIAEGIKPFLRLSGQEISDMMTQVFDLPDHELWSCSMSGQPAKTECNHHGRENDRNNAEFFDKITSQIPRPFNLKLLLNHLDEPSVLFPPSAHEMSRPNITDMGGMRVWDQLTKHCPDQKSKTAPRHGPPIDTYGLPFVTDLKSSMNLCEHPEYSRLHGLLLAPESLRLVEGLVPALSTGAPSTMGDILYPSSAYVVEDRFAYHADEDVDWNKKRNNLYWAGSTTGGHSHAIEWHNLHRQRFVELAQHLTQRPLYYLQQKDGVLTKVQSWFLNSRLYDVVFANVLQCDAKACREQKQYFKRKPWASGSRPFQSKLVFDLDGNGISGRYYKLLASKSAPLKQTLVREWHDDRLVPWVHYIPVSQSLEELPELVLYLTSTPGGQKQAKEIADQGREWFKKAFREVDYVIYMYRLLLELARLQDPQRPAWNPGLTTAGDEVGNID
ncbi:hypothetical protein F4808DRAFT_439844 [Astrocystis sublimbata]|nr:hypothetical protein F4808DRAFT_439844 [Astrocystis sublimbata]